MYGGLNYGSGAYAQLHDTGTLQTVTVTETVNRSDSLDIQTDFTVTSQETVNRADSLSTVTTFLKTIQETVSRVDSLSITTTFKVTIQETVSRVEKWIGNFWTLVDRVTGTSWTEDDRNPPNTNL